jgi:hypothetical protein
MTSAFLYEKFKAEIFAFYQPLITAMKTTYQWSVFFVIP